MKKIYTILLSLILVASAVLCVSVFSVSGGTSNRDVTDEDLAKAETMYWENFDSRYKEKIDSYNESKKGTSYESHNFYSEACTDIVIEDSLKLPQILVKYTDKYKDIDMQALFHNRTEYYSFLIELCDLYLDNSIPMTADDMVFIKNYVVYVGGPTKIMDNFTAEEAEARENAIKKSESTFGIEAQDTLWNKISHSKPIH